MMVAGEKMMEAEIRGPCLMQSTFTRWKKKETVSPRVFREVVALLTP